MASQQTKVVRVTSGTVGQIGEYSVGVANIQERDSGVVEAKVSVWHSDDEADAPVLFKGVLTRGDRVSVESLRLLVTTITLLPAGSKPGASRSYIEFNLE